MGTSRRIGLAVARDQIVFARPGKPAPAKGRDTHLHRLVAIKVSQARFSERFELEAAP